MRKILLALILLCSTFATAQNSLSPVAKQIFFGTTGSFIDKPLVGGKLYTYVSGTGTPLATYTSKSGSANPNPIILNAAGFADIWLQNGQAYRFVLVDSNGVQQYIVDNITGVTSGGGGGGVSGTLGNPMYGTGTSEQSLATEFSSDSFPGSDICAQTVNAIAVLPSNGGTVRLSCKDYTTRCSAPITIANKDSVTIEGCGGGQIQGVNQGGTIIHITAGVKGVVIDGTAQRHPVLKGFTIISDSSGSGTDNGIYIHNAGNPIVEDVHIKHFGGKGLFLDENTDSFRLYNVFADSNYSDGFFTPASCTDINVGNGIGLSSTFNGGWGFRLGCGVTNIWSSLHSSGNTAGDYKIDTSYNTFNYPYSEGGGTMVLGSGSKYGTYNFSFFGQPALTNNAPIFVNDIHWYASTGVPGTYPSQPFLALSDAPGASGGFYTESVVPVGFTHAGDLQLQDSVNPVFPNAAIPIFIYHHLGAFEFQSAMLFDQYIDMAAITAPANPSSGCRLFIDSGTGLLTGIDSLGNPCALGGSGTLTGTLTSGIMPVASGATTLIDGTITTDGTTTTVTGTGGLVINDGSGQAFMDVLEAAVPSNPTSGFQRWYANNSTHLLSCINSSGGSCAPSGGGGTIATTLLLLKGDNAGNAVAASASSVTGLFSGCSGINYLGADGACHAGTGFTNGAGANVIPKSDGTNLVASNLSDNGAAVTSAAPINAPIINLGTSPPTACSASAGCWAAAESSSASTPTVGVDIIRAKTGVGWVQSINGASETPFGNGTVTSLAVGNLSPIFTSSVATSTSTPVVTYALTTAGAHTFLMNNTGSTATPGYQAAACADISNAGAFCSGTAAASLSVGALANGMTATTQTVGDNTTKLATDAFVIANVAVGAGTGFNAGVGTTYQDVTETAAPSNPAGSNDRLWLDSTTHILKCKTSSGADCSPAGSGGLADPGANGVMTRTALNTTAQADAAAMAAPIVATSVGGSANAITITLTPAIAAQTQVGMKVSFTPGANTTTTNPTAAVSGLTALVIKKKSSTGLAALVSGDIVSGQMATLELDPSVTFWVLANPQAGGTVSAATPPLLISGSTVSITGQAAGATTTGSGATPMGIPYADQRVQVTSYGSVVTPFWTAGTAVPSVIGTGSNGGAGSGLTAPRSGNFVSAATNNSGAGWSFPNDFTTLAGNPRFSAEIALPGATDITNVITRVGLYTTATASTLNTATLTTVRFVGFRFVAGTDTNWQCEYGNASTTTIIDSGIAVAAGTWYKFVIVHDSSAATTDYYMTSANNAIPARVCSGPITTGVLNTAQVEAIAETISNGTNAQNIKIAYIQTVKDY